MASGSKHPTLRGSVPSDTQLLDHLQFLVDRRGEHDNTGQVMLNYEEHGPLVGVWAGEIGWSCQHKGSGKDVREAITESLQAIAVSSKRRSTPKRTLRRRRSPPGGTNAR